MENPFNLFATPHNSTCEDSSPLVSIEELMNLLKIGRNSAYQLLKSGQIKAFQIGTSWKIPRRSVEDFIYKKAGLF